MNIDVANLTPANSMGSSVELDPSYSAKTPFEFYLKPPGPGLDERDLQNGIDYHHYPHLMVSGHFFGSGTFVYYFPEDEVFYLWGDDFMDHMDGMVGPFRGDPRDALITAASPVDALPESISVTDVHGENCE